MTDLTCSDTETNTCLVESMPMVAMYAHMHILYIGLIISTSIYLRMKSQNL